MYKDALMVFQLQCNNWLKVGGLLMFCEQVQQGGENIKKKKKQSVVSLPQWNLLLWMDSKTICGLKIQKDCGLNPKVVGVEKQRLEKQTRQNVS